MRISTVSAKGNRRTSVESQRRGSSSASAPWYPLDTAAERLDVPIMQRALVHMGPYKPEHALKYSLALHTVVAAGHEPLCRLLLVCRADPKLKPENSRARAVVAFARKRLGRLLEAFAMVGDQKGQESHVTSVVTSVAETMFTAVRAGDSQFVHLIFGAAAKFGTGSGTQDVDILSRSVQQRNAFGQSLMHLWIAADAEAQDRQAIWKILSKHNVPGINARDRQGDSPLHLAVRQAILQIREEDGPEKLKLVRQLLEARAQPDLADAQRSETPLMEATCSGDVAACKLLLDFHADMNITSSTGMSVLDFAAEASPQVKQLFESKTCQQGIMAKVFSAVRELDSGRLCMLLRRHCRDFSSGSISILEPNSDDQTVLHLISELEVTPENEEFVPEIVGHLRNAAADLNCCNWFGETPLIVAARTAVKRRNQVQDRLRLAATGSFLNLGANPNIPDSLGETALMEAASEGDLPLCRLLVAGRAEVSQKSHAGRVAVDFLRSGETPELFQLLGSPGGQATTEEPGIWQSRHEEADPQNCKQQQDDQKTEPIGPDASTLQEVWSIVKDGNVKALQRVLHSAKDAGSVVNTRHFDGSTVLFFAAARVPDSRTCETIGLLLDFQASVEAQNRLGERPLTLAVRSALDHWHCNDSWGAQVVDCLLRRSAMPDVAIDLTGETPLMEASCRGGRALCQLLMAWSADPRLKSKAGLDARDFADAQGNEALSKLLGDSATPSTSNAALPRNNETPKPVPKTPSTDAADSDPSEDAECDLFKASEVQQTDAQDSDSSEEGRLEELHGKCAKEVECFCPIPGLCPNPGCVRPSGHCPPCMDAQFEEIKESVGYLCPTPGCIRPSDHCPPCMNAQCEEIE